MIVISNSEVEAYQRCHKAHWYAYGLKLTQRTQSMPLRCGILGHSVIEAYYRAKKADYTHTEAVEAGMDVMAEYMMSDHDDATDAEVMPIVTQRFLEYAQHYRSEPWRIVDVEGVYNIPLGGGVTYALTLDLLVEIIRGPYVGEQAIIDHKWTYDFWSPTAIQMAAQIPKYLWTLGKLGSTAKIGFLNQIRYRKMKDETPDKIFRRVLIDPTQQRMDYIMSVQKKMAIEIANLKLLGKSHLLAEATPSYSKQICDKCNFVAPCNIETDGRDPTATLQAMFKPNTYEYNEIKLRRSLE